LETKEKVARITELLTRKDGIVDELAALDLQMVALIDERDTIDGELHELLGVKVDPAPAVRVMTCGKCGQKGHNARKCSNGGSNG
jgi:hypothetical protein